jgi:hypothetical protein
MLFRSVLLGWVLEYGKRTQWAHLALYPLLQTVVATAFSAIHCAAWVSQFPSHTERLWQIVVVYVIGVPTLFLFFWVESPEHVFQREDCSP